MKTADHLIFVACCLVFVTVLPSFFSFYETPKFLYNAGKFTQLVEVMTAIARINGKKLLEKKHFAVEIIGDYESYELIDELEKSPLKFEVVLKKIGHGEEKAHEIKEYKEGFKSMFTSKK